MFTKFATRILNPSMLVNEIGLKSSSLTIRGLNIDLNLWNPQSVIHKWKTRTLRAYTWFLYCINS